MFGLGIDICEVERFERLKNNETFVKRIFSEEEIKYCSTKKNNAQYFAVRFAAKEAFLKAIGTGIGKGIRLKEIETCKNEFGKPFLNLIGETKNTFEKMNCGNIHLSLSHEKHNAVAVVIVEKCSILEK
jgi:holo-[acyl-carrier protein] synthase